MKNSILRGAILSAVLVMTWVTLAIYVPSAVSAGSESQTSSEGSSVATFAGGCFWCVESDFDHVPGVLSTTSGYTGGALENPTYKDVTSGKSGHLEAVQITFDAEQVSYEELLKIFWRSVDPTDGGGQFCDRGESYKTAIFANDDEQLSVAESSRNELTGSGVLSRPIVTAVVPATAFYAAETYHQDYYQKNPVRYRFYRFSCGRDAKIEALWGSQAHYGLVKN